MFRILQKYDCKMLIGCLVGEKATCPAWILLMGYELIEFAAVSGSGVN